MTYLIDGYNLLYAVGLAGRKLPPKGLERARTKLLDRLADAARGRPDVLRVVFDAMAAPAPSAEAAHRGVRVRFSYRQTADELIEELVHADPHPARLAVVSNDGQVRSAGRHRGCTVLSCEEFVDRMLEAPAAPTPDVPEPEKPEPDATPDEMAAWLATFSQPKRRRK